MHTIKRRASINCKLGDAFEYVADWKNFANYIPMFVKIEPTSLVHYGPGTSLDMTMRLGTKVVMTTTLDVVDFLKNRHIVMKSHRGIRTKTKWEFKDIGGKILTTLDFEYDLPPGLTLREGELNMLAKDLEDSWAKSLDMLKWILESMPPSPDDDY